MIEHLSASAINKWNRCHRMFQYKYVDRVDIEQEESDHIYLGNVVHESIENILNEYGVQENEDVVLELLRDEAEQLHSEYPYDRSEFEEQAQTCLETASRFLADIPGIKDIEERWTMQDNQFQNIEWVGYSDLVMSNDTIVDWKTGNVMSDQKELVQSGVYAKLFENEYGYEPDTVMFLYLREEEGSKHSKDNNAAIWKNYWENIHDTVKKIVRAEKTKDEFEATPKEQSVCHWCDYKGICSEYVGAEKVKPHNISFKL